MGDAAGVGPEIVVKALAPQKAGAVHPSLPGRGRGRVDSRKQTRFTASSTHSDLGTSTPTPTLPLRGGGSEKLYALCRPLVVGDVGVLAQAQQMLGLQVTLNPVADVEAGRFEPGKIDVLHLANIDLARLKAGEVSAMAGKAAVEYVLRAGRMALSGEVQGIATAPLNKEAMQLGGYDYIGHTEILADLTQSPRCTTMLISGSLRVVHVTRHIPLRQVADSITMERVLETIQLTAEGLPGMGVVEPRLGVAALNPHGGEGGLLGREEIEEIAPAVEAAQALGIDARGPYPADSIFFRAIAGEFDAVVAMYHDQGHIPVKTHGFESSVTVTLGLPIVRTSVDHGTAFDIAWQASSRGSARGGVASPQSLVEAIKLAAQMAGWAEVQ
jgi:4-hydroxythreonine-4-phosphate dehydrogenase